MFTARYKIQNILSLFTKIVVLKTDTQGNLKDIILNTQTDLKRNIKNISEIFSESESERIKQLLQYPSTQSQYLKLSKEYQGKKYINIKVAAEKNSRYVLLTFPNISEEKILKKKEYEELKDLSQTDQLTKVLNRRGLFNKASKLILNCDPYERIGIAFVDIDNLKQVNDKFGHNKGDQVISIMADTIRNNARSRDIIARLGGDEFVIVTEEVSGRRSTILGLANKLQKKIQSSKLPTTLSIGIHVFRAKKIQTCIRKTSDFEGCFFEELEYADQAAYKSKSLGKNQINVSSTFKRYYKTLSTASE